MVFMDSRILGYRPLLWRWLNTRTRPGESEALSLLLEKYAAPAIDWVCQGLDGHDIVRPPQLRLPHPPLCMAAQLTRLLDATLIDHPKMQDPQVRHNACMYAHTHACMRTHMCEYTSYKGY